MKLVISKISISMIILVILSLVNVHAEIKTSTLSNGLRVILIPDHTCQLICSVIMVKTGSANETAATQGLSHFLEHMLFNGTARYSREELKELYDLHGIYNNAFTRPDYTAYEIVMPSKYLKLGLETQSEQIYRSILPEETFSKERAIVVEEIKKDRDIPSSYLEDQHNRFFYKGTAYQEPVIGFENIIASISRAEVLDFYHHYYTPDNSSLILVGDFSGSEALPIIESFFGQIPASNYDFLKDPEAQKKTKANLDKNQFGINVIEANTKTLHLKIGFPAPLITHQEAVAYTLMTHLLASGDNSIIQQVLSGTKDSDSLAHNISASYDPYADTAGLQVYMVPVNENDLDKIVNKIKEALNTIKNQKVNNSDLDAAKLAIESYYIYQNEKYLNLAREIANWEAIASFEYYQEYLEKIKQVSAAEIQEVANKYLDSDNFQVTLLKPSAKSSELSQEVKDLDQPTKKKPIVKKVLQNGLILIVKEDPEALITAATVLVKDRTRLEPEGLAGVGEFVSNLLPEGTNSRNAQQISKELEQMAAKLKVVDDPYLPFDDYYNSKDYSYLRFETLTRFSIPGLELVADLLQNPAFEESAISRVSKKMPGLIAMQSDSASTVAQEAFLESLYPNNSFKYPLQGTFESISKINREALIGYHKQAYAPNNLIISVVSAQPKEEMLSFLENLFKNMPSVQLQKANFKPESPITQKIQVIRELPKERAHIYWGNRLPAANQLDDLPALILAAQVLERRMAEEIREKQGLAYRLSADAYIGPQAGWFEISMATQDEKVPQALTGIENLWQDLVQKEISEKELILVRNSYLGHILRYHESRINQSYYLAYYEFLGLGFEAGAKLEMQIQKVTSADILKAAQKYFQPQNSVQALVRKKLE